MAISLTSALSEAQAAAVLIPDRATYTDGLIGILYPGEVPSQRGALVMCLDIIYHVSIPCWRALRETRGDRDASHRR
jgi:hypothetical protein